MDTQLINSNNLKEKLKNIGLDKDVSQNIQSWLDTTVHKHWSKRLPQENFTGFIDEPWFKEKSKDTQFKQLVLTPVFVSEVHHLIDFLKANYQFERNEELIQKPLNKLNYLECERQANEWIKSLNKKISLEEDWDNLKLLSTINYEGQDYNLYELTSRQNIRREGKVMNNCISTYADSSDDILSNIKFYSIRDKNNKSLASIKLERVYYEKNHQEALEKISSDYKVFEITEIKEKNNEFLDSYRSITKLFINQILEDNNYYVAHICNIFNTYNKSANYSSVLEEAQLILLEDNKVIELGELNENNYNSVKIIPNSINEKLKEKILLPDNMIPFKLMNITGWVNITPLHKEHNVSINNRLLKLNINSPTLKKLDIDFQSVNTEKSQQKLRIENSKSLEINVHDVKLVATIINSKNISINHKIEMRDFKYMSHNVFIDSEIKVINCNKGVIAKFLSIDSIIEDTGLYNEKSYIPKYEILSLDTKKGTIKTQNSNNIQNKLSLIPFMEDFQQISMVQSSSNSLEDFLSKKIKIKDVIVDSAVDALEIDNSNPYNLTFILPIKNKNNILLAINDYNKFKKEMINYIIDKCRLSIYEKDFYDYLSIEHDMDNKINLTALEMQEINKKFEGDINAINYAEPVKTLLNNFFPKEEGIISCAQINNLEKIRDMFIENFQGHRVNASRTNLSKNAQRAIISILLNDCTLSDEAQEEIENIVSLPHLRLRKRIMKDNV